MLEFAFGSHRSSRLKVLSSLRLHSAFTLKIALSIFLLELCKKENPKIVCLVRSESHSSEYLIIKTGEAGRRTELKPGKSLHENICVYDIRRYYETCCPISLAIMRSHG